MTATGTLVTTSEAAPLLGVTERYVRLLAAEGRLVAAIKTPWGRLFERAEVERLAAERHAARAAKET
jgi:excisionase family DNA binding protein